MNRSENKVIPQETRINRVMVHFDTKLPEDPGELLLVGDFADDLCDKERLICIREHNGNIHIK